MTFRLAKLSLSEGTLDGVAISAGDQTVDILWTPGGETVRMAEKGMVVAPREGLDASEELVGVAIQNMTTCSYEWVEGQFAAKSEALTESDEILAKARGRQVLIPGAELALSRLEILKSKIDASRKSLIDRIEMDAERLNREVDELVSSLYRPLRLPDRQKESSQEGRGIDAFPLLRDALEFRDEEMPAADPRLHVEEAPAKKAAAKKAPAKKAAIKEARTKALAKKTPAKWAPGILPNPNPLPPRKRAQSSPSNREGVMSPEAGGHQGPQVRTLSIEGSVRDWLGDRGYVLSDDETKYVYIPPEVGDPSVLNVGSRIRASIRTEGKRPGSETLWVVASYELLDPVSAPTDPPVSSHKKKRSRNGQGPPRDSARQGERKIPDVTGWCLPEAEESLARLGLVSEIVVKDGKRVIARKNWVVARMIPGPGTRIGRGRSVRLEVRRSKM